MAGEIPPILSVEARNLQVFLRQKPPSRSEKLPRVLDSLAESLDDLVKEFERPSRKNNASFKENAFAFLGKALRFEWKIAFFTSTQKKMQWSETIRYKIASFKEALYQQMGFAAHPLFRPNAVSGPIPLLETELPSGNPEEIVLSSNGTRAAVIMEDGGLYLYTVPQEEPSAWAHVLKIKSPASFFPPAHYSVTPSDTYFSAFSPNSQYFALWAEDRIHVFNVEKGGEIQTRRAGSKPAFTPDSQTLLTGGEPGEVHFINLKGETGRMHTNVGRGRNNGFVVSPDGSKYVAVNEEDGALHIRDFATGSEIAQVHDHCEISPVFSPDSKKLAIVSDKGPISIYDSQEGKEIGRFFHVESADDEFSIFFESRVFYYAFSASGQSLVCAISDYQGAKVFMADFETRKTHFVNPFSESAGAELGWVTFSENGTRFAEISKEGKLHKLIVSPVIAP